MSAIAINLLLAQSGIDQATVHVIIAIVAGLTPQVLVRSDENGQSLYACVFIEARGDSAPAPFIVEGAELVWTFEARSHLEAMTIYHRRVHGENYWTDEEWADDPYPDEWLDAQKSGST